MPHFRHRFLSVLRFGLLLASVLLVLGLNQRTVNVLRMPTPKSTRFSVPPRATVIKQKVLLEATASLTHFVAPTLDAWLPTPMLASWLPTLRRVLAAPRPLCGVPASAFFRTRLLAVVLSPQAP